MTEYRLQRLWRTREPLCKSVTAASTTLLGLSSYQGKNVAWPFTDIGHHLSVTRHNINVAVPLAVSFVSCQLTSARSTGEENVHRREVTKFMAVLRSRRRSLLCEGQLGRDYGWLYSRLESGCHGSLAIVIWEKRKRVPVQHPEVCAGQLQ